MKHAASKPAAPKPTVDRPRGHKIFDKKILTFPVSLLLLVICSVIVGFPTIHILSGDESMANSVAIIVASMALILWYQFHFRKELGNILGWTTTGMIIGAPGVLFALPNIMDIFKHIGGLNPVLPALLLALAPGISEEIAFRAIPVSNWMRVSCTKRDILPCVFVSALIFGLIHSLNGAMGADIPSTILQVFYATCLGVFFGAVFLRCGSILPCILLHTFIDFTAFLTMDLANGGLMTEALEINAVFYVTLAVSIFVFVLGLYLVRPSGQDEIVALWEEKTHRA